MLFGLVVLVATVPLTVMGVRFARKNRNVAFATASLLLMFGVNFSVDPPPPPRLEAVEREDEKEKQGEPK